MRNHLYLLSLLTLLMLASTGSSAVAQTASQTAMGTTFTYQGVLQVDSSPADGSFDFGFVLFDAAAGGAQVGDPVTVEDVPVSNGVFTVQLDFGRSPFAGEARWLEVGVRPGSDTGPYTPLSPRQALTASPYALYAPPGNTLVAADGDPLDAVFVDDDGDVGVGTTSPGERLTVAGVVESTAGGFKFPDGTTQTTAAAANVGQLVQEFVVSSDHAVTAGDVVSFVNGAVQPGIPPGHQIRFGDEAVLNAAETEYISAAALSPTRVVIAYADQGNLGDGTLVVGEVSGRAIDLSSPVVFNPADTYGIEVAPLSPTRFVIACVDNGEGSAMIGEIGDTVVSFGPAVTYGVTSGWANSVAALSSTRVVVAFADWNNSRVGTARVGNVSGTDITFGGGYVFSSAAVGYTGLAPLSATRFAVAYNDDSNGDAGTAVVGGVGGVAGTSIVFGSEIVFNPAATVYISAAALSPNALVVAYTDNGLGGAGAAIVGEVSVGAITFGPEAVFDGSLPISFISVSALSPEQFVVAYREPAAPYGKAIVGDVSGASITFGADFAFSSLAAHHNAAAALPSTGRLVIAYQGFDTAVFGAAIVGDTVPEEAHVVGLARDSRPAGQAVSVIISGVSDLHAGLTPGALYFSDLSGNLTTANTGRPVGLAISETELLLDIRLFPE